MIQYRCTNLVIDFLMYDDKMVFEVVDGRERDVAEAARSVVELVPVLMVKCASDKTTVTYEANERLRDPVGLFQMLFHVLGKER